MITKQKVYRLSLRKIYKMSLIYSLDLLGTFVFAISGTLAAAERRFDIFGAMFTGLITAVGGGTIRDLMLDAHPLSWIEDSNYLIVVTIAVVSAFVFKKNIIKLKQTLFLFDTIGIGVFTIIGLEKALILGNNFIVAIIMGVVTAIMGGILRDTFCNDVPLIFRKEIYATACLIGALAFLAFSHMGLDPNLNLIITILLIIGIRILSIRFKLSLPKFSS